MLKKILSISLMGLSCNLLACSCFESSLENNYNDNDNVVLAKLVGANMDYSINGYPIIKGKFKLIKNFKGNSKKILNLETGIGGGDCGIPMNIGKKYVIFKDKKTEFINICDGSVQLKYKNDEILIKLDNLSKNINN